VWRWHANAGGNIVGKGRGDADTEIDEKPVAQLLGGARGHLVACPGHQTSSPVPAGAAVRLRTVRCSMCFTALGTCTKRLTKTPGVMMWSGLISPGCTRCSTSATVILPAVAIMGLKLRAVLRYTRLPSVSPIQAWMIERSATSPRSMT